MARAIQTTAEQADRAARGIIRRSASLAWQRWPSSSCSPSEARAEALQRARPEFEGLEADIAALLRPEQMDAWRKLYRKFLLDWVPEKPTGRLDRERAEQLKQLGYIHTR